MRRSQFDCKNQPVRNLFTNPAFETASGTVNVRTNLFTNPSFEAASGTANVRTNLATNPSFETASGTTNVRTNLATNPSFETANGTVNVRTNLITHPSFQTTSGSTINHRINLFNGSTMVLGAGATQTLNVSYRGSTWNRVSSTTAGHGIRFYTNLADLVNGATYATQIELANDGAAAVTVSLDWCDTVATGGSHTIQPGERKRVTMTGSRATYDSTFRFTDIGLPTVDTNILYREILIEKDYIKGQYFDGATTAASYNHAMGKPVTSPVAVSNPSRFTDGGTDNVYAQIADGVNSYLQVDLGSVTMLDTLKVFHYNYDGRSYYGTKTEVSVDGVSWSTIYDSAVSGIYQETAAGKTHTFAVRGVRYIRDWLNGSTSNTGNHWLEIQAFNLSTTDFTYGWFGSANTSTSYVKVNGLAGWTPLGTLYQSNNDPKFGTHSAALTTNGANGDGIFPANNIPISASKTYTYSGWVKATSAHALSLAFRWTDASSVSTGSDTATLVTSQLVVGGWARVTATATAPAGTTQVQLLARIYETHTPTTLYFDGMSLIEGSVDVPFFDGSTADSGDFTYAWIGTANASTSNQIGTALSGVGPANQAVAYRTGATGAYEARILFNGSTIVDSGMSFAGILTVAASKTYTVSVDLTSDVARTVKFSAQGTGTVNQNSANISLAAGVKTRQSWSFTTTATAPAGVALYILRADTVLGTLNVDDMLIEEGSYVGDYFDGSNTLQNLVSNPSFETNLTGWNTVGTTTTTRDTAKSIVGTASMKVDTSSGAAYSGALFGGPALVAGKTYTWSAYIWAPTGTNVNFAADALGVNTTVTGNSAWQRVSVTGRYVSGSAFYIRSIVANQAAFWVDGVMLERSSRMNSYYEGLGDFTYAWAGTAGSSVSYQRGIFAISADGALASAISSTEWSLSGSRSLRIIPTTSSIDSRASIGGDTGGMRLGMQAGKAYTISATCRLVAPQTGALASSARSIRFFYKVGTGAYTSVDSTAAPNVAGSTRLSVTLTLPAGTTEAFVRLQNGATVGGGDTWWDDVLIEETPLLKPYFDGSTPIKNEITNPSFTVDTTGWNLWSSVAPLPAHVASGGGAINKPVVSLNRTSGATVIVSSADSYRIPVRPGEVLTYSALGSVSAGTAMAIDVEFWNAATGGSWIGGSTRRYLSTASGTSTDVVATNTPKRWGASHTVPAGATHAILRVFRDSAADGVTWFTDAMIERTTVLNPFYAGQGDFTYVWSGTANASTSVQQAPGAAGTSYVSSLSYAYQSTTAGVRTGTKSIRITPTHATNGDSFAELNSMLAGYAFKPNTTYTLSGDRTILAPQTNLAGTTHFRINVGGELTPTLTESVANVAGTQRVVGRFTTGTSTALGFVRLYNGSAAGGGDVWWDNIVLEEGVTDGSYFDGATPITNTVHNPDVSINTSDWVSGQALTRVFEDGKWWMNAPAGTYTYAGLATVAGQYYAASLRVKGPAGTVVTIVSTDNVVGGFIANTSATIPASGEMVITSASGSEAPKGIYSYIGVAGLSAATKITEAYAEKVSGPGKLPIYPYFKGTGDFTYSWSGTANASTSIQRASGLPEWGVESDIQLWQSHNKNARLRYKGYGGATSIYFNPTIGTLRVGEYATYIVRARAIGTPAKFIMWFWGDDSTSGYSPTATIGTEWAVYQKSVLITQNIVNLNTMFVTVGSGEVELEYVMLKTGTIYTGPYVDGSKPFSRWDGTANASTSIGYPYG